MSQIQFIFLTLVLVVLIVFFANRILSKFNRQKKVLKQEPFSQQLNNLDKIILSVAKKDEPEERNTETTETADSNTEDVEEADEEKPTEKKNKSTNKQSYLRNTIISEEIMKPKHKD